MTLAELYGCVAAALGPSPSFRIELEIWRHSHDGVPSEPRIRWQIYLAPMPDADEERFEGATPRDAWLAFEAGVAARGSDVQAASDAVGDGKAAVSATFARWGAMGFVPTGRRRVR